MRVRASAGAGSFRRNEKLEGYLEAARAAVARLPEIKAIKKRQGKNPDEARASMTDAEATVMKMGDGSFRPAYNPQLASDADSLVIVGVDVATVGSDQGQMVPMVEQVIARCGG